eukprot:scaffold30420_cov160-Skeletonema_dohrnii-CCMP3373.AAC.2
MMKLFIAIFKAIDTATLKTHVALPNNIETTTAENETSTTTKAATANLLHKSQFVTMRETDMRGAGYGSDTIEYGRYGGYVDEEAALDGEGACCSYDREWVEERKSLMNNLTLTALWCEDLLTTTSLATSSVPNSS